MLDIEFFSIFKEELKLFIKYKKGLGYKYNNQTRVLKKIDNKMLNLTLKSISKNEFKDLTKNDGMTHNMYAIYYRIYIDFCEFLKSNGYKDIYYEKKKFNTTKHRQPIIFNENEIKKLFETIDNFTNNSSKKFYKLYYTYGILFRLVYSCGLRISEGLNITIKDINLDENSIKILDSKNHASRIIAFSETMKQCLVKYIDTYNIKDGLLFKNKKDKKIEYCTIRRYYKKILQESKLDIKSTIHCLRHIFVNTTFNKMIEKGYDENIIIIYLHKYLGHKSIYETEYYLHFTNYKKKMIIENNATFSKLLYEGVDIDDE